MSLRYIVSPVTVQGYASDYKVLSLQCPINHLRSHFSLSSSLSSFGIVSPSSHLCLCSIHHFPTSIWLLLAQINFIIIISICLSTWICLDCFDHTRRSLILTLLSCSNYIEPWDKSMLAPTTTNCSTWASAYRSAPPPSYYLQLEPTTKVQYPRCCQDGR